MKIIGGLLLLCMVTYFCSSSGKGSVESEQPLSLFVQGVERLREVSGRVDLNYIGLESKAYWFRKETALAWEGRILCP